MRTVFEYNDVQYTLDIDGDTVVATIITERPGLDNPAASRITPILRRGITTEVMHGVVHNAIANAMANGKYQ